MWLWQKTSPKRDGTIFFPLTPAKIPSKNTNFSQLKTLNHQQTIANPQLSSPNRIMLLICSVKSVVNFVGSQFASIGVN
jgi:hypothetical protein